MENNFSRNLNFTNLIEDVAAVGLDVDGQDGRNRGGEVRIESEGLGRRGRVADHVARVFERHDRLTDVQILSERGDKLAENQKFRSNAENISKCFRCSKKLNI